MNSAIILAGGLGKRIGKNIPKQFLKINNKMIIDFSIEAFEKNKNIDEIIIVCHNEWIKYINSKYDKKIKIIKGGKTRSESSYYGLKSCNKNCKYVFIHDAARPFIDCELIDSILYELKKYLNKNYNLDALVTSLKNKDSIFYNKNNEYLDRDEIRIIQTPQLFKFKRIVNAYKNCFENNRMNNFYKDDLSLLLDYKKNLKYKFFINNKVNFKITTNDDLNLFKEIINGI